MTAMLMHAVYRPIMRSRLVELSYTK